MRSSGSAFAIGAAAPAPRPRRARHRPRRRRWRATCAASRTSSRARQPADPGGRPRAIARPGRCAAGSRGDGQAAASPGYHLATARLFVVDDYFFPMYVIRPRRGHRRSSRRGTPAGAFKKFGYSVLDKSFGADEALVEPGRHPLQLRRSASSPSDGGAVHYAEAFRQPRRPVRVAPRAPADRRVLRRRRAAARAEAASGDATASPPAGGSSSTPRRSAATRARRPLRRRRSTSPRCTEALGDDHVVLAPAPPVRPARRPSIGAGSSAGFADRRLGPPRHQRADARQRRPRDRLLERDLRVRAARPADGLPRARRRGLRARARLLPRLPARHAGADLRDDRASWRRGSRRATSIRRGPSPSRRRASTWPTAGRASGSWTRSCCRRCGPAGSTWRRSRAGGPRTGVRLARPGRRRLGRPRPPRCPRRRSR